ncbi:hypothetical protein H4696_006858 [Amycolatopsis lexingtonensis]|uniref:Uncharacterized protein n=1 Tax=Amycolatopsis lexingtonensis TaxID=218822 RepID=A0ABR9I9A2_9PSEU|nr:hypothetical protein [Amycolatopsis lexingtonensis]MBE1499758.1 hypothetical protein [Amycolatopsis lexingtonensis]
MTDLERKLADALREEADKVTPNLDAAWAEQLRRQHRPRRRRGAVWLAPLAAASAVLISVLVGDQLNTASPPTPASPMSPATTTVTVAAPQHVPSAVPSINGGPVGLMSFTGQTDTWKAYAFTSHQNLNWPLFCVAAMPDGQPFDKNAPQFGLRSPLCALYRTDANQVIFAQQVGEEGGPLPADRAIYLADCTVRELRLYNSEGDLSQAARVGQMLGMCVFLADITAGKPPVRFDAHSGQVVRSGSISVG